MSIPLEGVPDQGCTRQGCRVGVLGVEGEGHDGALPRDMAVPVPDCPVNGPVLHPTIRPGNDNQP